MSICNETTRFRTKFPISRLKIAVLFQPDCFRLPSVPISVRATQGNNSLPERLVASIERNLDPRQLRSFPNPAITGFAMILDRTV